MKRTKWARKGRRDPVRVRDFVPTVKGKPQSFKQGCNVTRKQEVQASQGEGWAGALAGGVSKMAKVKQRLQLGAENHVLDSEFTAKACVGIR